MDRDETRRVPGVITLSSFRSRTNMMTKIRTHSTPGDSNFKPEVKKWPEFYKLGKKTFVGHTSKFVTDDELQGQVEDRGLVSSGSRLPMTISGGHVLPGNRRFLWTVLPPTCRRLMVTGHPLFASAVPLLPVHAAPDCRDRRTAETGPRQIDRNQSTNSRFARSHLSVARGTSA